MYVADLLCEREHRFEAWFQSVEDLDSQTKRGLVQCPICQSTQVRKLPAGPRVKRGAGTSPAQQSPNHVQQLQALYQHLSNMAGSAEDVGERFPREARRMHYGEIDAKTIKGAASPVEVREMLEEGIPVLPVPPKKESAN